MKQIIVYSALWFLLPIQAVIAQDDYTSRNYTNSACELFANDAYQAADNYSNGIMLHEILAFIKGATVSENEKHRIFQAIQFVWINQLDNPVMAYTLAMGLCLKPKNKMAPLDEPWISSPRIAKEHV